MADWVQGDTVVDYITLTDGSGTVVTGAAWTTIDTIDPDGVAFTLTISEVGGGVYKAQFTADKAGRYYWSAETSNIDPNQAFEQDFTVIASSSSTSGVVTTTTTEGTQLLDIIRMLATRMGDFKRIVATANGAADGTSFVDTIRLAAMPAESLSGSELVIISPAQSTNYLQSTMVEDFSGTNKVLTLDPPFSGQVVTGDEAYMVNLRSEGNYLVDYTDAIGNAIWNSYPGHLVGVTYTPTDDTDAVIPWDPNSPWLDLPTSLKKISGVEAYQLDDEQHSVFIPMTPQNRPSLAGWYFDFATKRLVINEPFRSAIDGFVTRIRGYGRAARLVNFTDVTTVDTEWIVNLASEELLLGTGDQKKLAAASMQRNNAELVRGKMVTITVPGTLDLGN